MKKNVTIKVLFCEANSPCMNKIGYAGFLVRNPITEQRQLVCAECRKLPRYKGWITEMNWKND